MGEDISPLLLVRKMLQSNNGHFLFAHLLKSKQAAMTFDDDVVFVDGDGIVVPELLHRSNDLIDLLLGVELRVVFIGVELLNREHLYFEAVFQPFFTPIL